MKVIYDIRISTTNPSADICGYFSSKVEAKKEIERMKTVIGESPDYYGKWEDCVVSENIIYVTNKLEY